MDQKIDTNCEIKKNSNVTNVNCINWSNSLELCKNLLKDRYTNKTNCDDIEDKLKKICFNYNKSCLKNIHTNNNLD